MAVDPIKLPVLAEAASDENWDFRTYVKFRLDCDEFDAAVLEVAGPIIAATDCTACANCCKHVHPTLTEEDLDRLAQRLQLSREQVVERYLIPNERSENPWRTASTPCPFLQDNRCSVYEDRPADCREYPYLEGEDFVSRLMSMIGRTSTCPIVYETMEKLKPAVGYLSRSRTG